MALPLPMRPDTGAMCRGGIDGRVLKRVAIFQIRFPRFRSLFLRMSLAQKPLHSFARHAVKLRDRIGLRKAGFSTKAKPAEFSYPLDRLVLYST